MTEIDDIVDVLGHFPWAPEIIFSLVTWKPSDIKRLEKAFCQHILLNITSSATNLSYYSSEDLRNVLGQSP